MTRFPDARVQQQESDNARRKMQRREDDPGFDTQRYYDCSGEKDDVAEECPRQVGVQRDPDLRKWNCP